MPASVNNIILDFSLRQRNARNSLFLPQIHIVRFIDILRTYQSRFLSAYLSIQAELQKARAYLFTLTVQNLFPHELRLDSGEDLDGTLSLARS